MFDINVFINPSPQQTKGGGSKSSAMKIAAGLLSFVTPKSWAWFMKMTNRSDDD